VGRTSSSTLNRRYVLSKKGAEQVSKVLGVTRETFGKEKRQLLNGGERLTRLEDWRVLGRSRPEQRGKRDDLG